MPATRPLDELGTAGPRAWGPGKAMRIGSMTGQVLEELRGCPLDGPTRARIAALHDQAVRELAASLPTPMREELVRLMADVSGAAPPSQAELRVAEAQLVGWVAAVVANAESAAAVQALASAVADLAAGAEGEQPGPGPVGP